MTKLTIDGAFSSIAYKGVVKKLIYQFKYKPYLADLKNVLIDFFYEGLIQKEQLIKSIESRKAGSLVFVPVPLHSSRFKNRGYNQAQILAEELAKRFNSEMLDALKRIKKTRSQVGLKKKERKENMLKAFALRKDADVAGKNILLVDDVLTTGSTLSSAATVLKQAKANRVWGLTLAIDQ